MKLAFEICLKPALRDGVTIIGHYTYFTIHIVHFTITIIIYYQLPHASPTAHHITIYRLDNAFAFTVVADQKNKSAGTSRKYPYNDVQMFLSDNSKHLVAL